MNLFMWNGKMLVENAEPIGSLCACELGKRLVFRSDFTMLIVTVATGIIYCSFMVRQPCGKSFKVIVLLNPQTNSR